ncbi:MAG: 16S rRNA (cytidine(1402)-2'-O)-methyltransferase [Patescibacteria group bacterium]|jgi:16S rRNA (cytidine1402-2'-O)-methyltransferase
MHGTLFMVATPIGNLEDITLRALKTLKDVDAIACEDTRVTSKLISGTGLSGKKLIALHEHTDQKRLDEIVARLVEGQNIAYVSDAGTPGVNDPGGKLVAAALEAGVPVVPLPGPSAMTCAISVCGFPMDDFRYLGFVPHKKGRETFFRELAEREEASIFFESTHRIAKTMESLKTHLDSERGVFIGRELTKMHETLYRGTITEVASRLQETSTKGEFVIIIAPKGFKV